MADFLTIEGQGWEVLVKSGAKLSLDKIESFERAWDGTPRTSRRDQFMNARGWQTRPLTQAEGAVFVLYDDGTLKDISGAAFGDAPLQGFVRLSAPIEHVADGSTIKHIYTFDIEMA